MVLVQIRDQYNQMRNLTQIVTVNSLQKDQIVVKFDELYGIANQRELKERIQILNILVQEILKNPKVKDITDQTQISTRKLKLFNDLLKYQKLLNTIQE